MNFADIYGSRNLSTCSYGKYECLTLILTRGCGLGEAVGISGAECFCAGNRRRQCASTFRSGGYGVRAWVFVGPRVRKSAAAAVSSPSAFPNYLKHPIGPPRFLLFYISAIFQNSYNFAACVGYNRGYMALSTQPYKGARDFYPEDKRLQKYLFAQLRKTVERFGYEEYDAPILESLELYLAKTGEEIVNEQTYAFEDRGGRKVVIRPEMTPTVSRMVAARRQELAYPLRWYSIPNLWRYERPQRGRLREHWQLNVDIFGLADTQAEFEVISLANQIFEDFGAKPDMYEIRLNSRVFMDYVLHDYLALDEVEAHGIAKLIDRMHKLDQAAFIAQADALVAPVKREAGVIEKLLDVLHARYFSALPPELQQYPAVETLKTMLDQLQEAGIHNAVFDVTLMRGFDYYTDIVFEVFDTDPENNRSMMGGGRYDGLVGLFGVEPVPTVGFGLGDATLANFLESHHLLPELHSETQLYVAAVGEVNQEAEKLVNQLRAMGLNVAVGAYGRRLGDHFKTAEKKGIAHVLIVGEKELANEQFTIKDLQSGNEEKHSLERIVSLLQDHRLAD